MEITPYTHQSDMISDVRKNLRTYRRVLLQSPTGSGKTIMSLIMHSNASQKGKVSFFICHRRELIDQTAGTFRKNGLDFGIIAADYEPDYSKKIQICSIDTLKNRLDKIPTPDLCVWDECQHIAAAGWARVQAHFDSAFHIGLSATPERLSGEGLDDYFDYMVLGPPVRWLIDNGFLADYRLFSVPGCDMSNAATTSEREYKASDAETAIDKPEIIGDIVKTWQKYADGRLTIGFAPTVAMSKKFTQAFCDAGIPAIHLDGNTPKKERRSLLRRFASGEFKVAFNVGLFGEGYDLAANSGMDVTIGYVIDAAPTQAVSMWLQRCGRGLRKQDGKSIIADHAGNALRHGLPCSDRQWSLSSKKRSRAKQDDEPTITVKQCKKCFCAHKPAPTCPECGYVYPVQERKIEHKDGELVEITKEQQEKKEQRMEQGRAQTVRDLINIGMSRARATRIIQARQEKERLQVELFNLSVALGVPMIKTEIRGMKPKELREKIDEITNAGSGINPE